MKLQYDLIALDVDGTLLTDGHQLLPEVKEAVREAAEGGAEIVLCTGRGPLGALPVLESLELQGTMIVHNGAAAVRSEDRGVLFQYEMDPEPLLAFVQYSREHGIHFDLNTAFEMLLESMSEEARSMYAHHGVEPVVKSFGGKLPEGLVKMSVFGTMETIDRVQADWEAWPSRLAIIRSGDLFIDVQHPESSKGNALRRLAEKRGIDRSRILAVGNYYNDVTMLQYAGFGIAMSNSPDPVKKEANAVSEHSNNEGGVAEALRRYGWR
jgi:HAD-superfamily hydrolase, subfamily IIB